MRIKGDADGIVLSEVYSGVGIKTDMGLFGIAQRDSGIEVMLDGKTVWTSHEIRVQRTEEQARINKQWAAYCPPGSKVSKPVRLPDGSGFFTASWPLPKTHWLYAEERSEPPMPMRVGLGAKRSEIADQIQSAARYAIRASTMNGKETDFDPDAMVQNMIIGLIGRWTEDGR